VKPVARESRLELSLQAEQCVKWIGKGGDHAAPHAVVGVGAKNNQNPGALAPRSNRFGMVFGTVKRGVRGPLLASEVRVKLTQTLGFFT
jgi:hypothetical protein